MVVIDGVNTDRMPRDDKEQLIKALAGGIDSELTSGTWSFFSTSSRGSSEELADRREERGVYAWRHGLSDHCRRVMSDSADYIRKDDAEWNSRTWEHMIEVSVLPQEAADGGICLERAGYGWAVEGGES